MRYLLITLALIYSCLQTHGSNNQEGLDALNSTFELTKPEDQLLGKISLHSKAVLAYSTVKDNKNMLSNLLKMKKVTEDFISQSKDSLADTCPILLFIEAYHSIYYTRNGEPDKALQHLQNAEKLLNPKLFIPYGIAYITACTEYYQSIKENKKALSYLDSVIKLMTPLSLKDAMIFKTKKANLLVKMGLTEEALPLYEKIIKVKDSLCTDISASQMEETLFLYNMDNLMMQQEKRLNNIHYISLIFIGIILIALSLFNIRMYCGRKRLEKYEKEMKRLTNIAEEANDMKSNFLSNMIYNIRTPLNNVVGFSQLMSENPELSKEERKEYSNIIQSNSAMLIQLVNDVLDLSRLEAKMMKFQICNFSVHEWCNDLPRMVQMQSEGAISLNLKAEVGDSVIQTDINKLNQFILSMVLYPTECKVAREVTMTLAYNPEQHKVTCKIENSPLVDPMFASQKVSIHKRINELFFKHFNGNFSVEEKTDGIAVLHFTYPTLTT